MSTKIKVIAPYEVLAQPVAPAKLMIPNLPYVVQGVFVQLTNLDDHNAVTLNLEYVGTPAFTLGSGAVKLFTDIIDQAGAVTIYNNTTFLTGPIGFKAQTIPKDATFLFGVQYVLEPPPPPTTTPATGGTPQDSAASRGYVKIEAPSGTKLLVSVTTRQVFTNYAPGGTVLDLSEGAYAVPVVGGPEVTF